MALTEKIEKENLNKYKNIVKNGDVVSIHEFNWDFTERNGEKYQAVILWKDSSQPLILKVDDLINGEYRPVWGTYEDIIDIIDHINIDKLIVDKLIIK